MPETATPIRGEDGGVASVAIAMRDLEPLDEPDRPRAEFPGPVSHEPRTPLASIEGSTTTALDASPALDPAGPLRFFRVIDVRADRMRGLVGGLLDAGRIGAGTLPVPPGPAGAREPVERAGNALPKRRTIALRASSAPVGRCRNPTPPIDSDPRRGRARP